jgi:hypothetical protein
MKAALSKNMEFVLRDEINNMVISATTYFL